MNAVMLQTYWRTDEYIVEYEQNGSDGLWGTETAGRTPASFVRFIRNRVCETQKELLRLMGQTIALVDEGVKRANYEGVNALLDVIATYPGKRANELATLIEESVQTVERYVRTLKDSGKIEFRGAPKNGGYYAI